MRHRERKAARPRVVIVQAVVLQYRVPFYRLLRRRLDEAGIDLDLVHSNPPADQDVWGDAVDLPWAHHVPMRRLPLGGRELLWQRCRELVRRGDLVIVEQASRHVINYRLSLEQLLGRRRLAYWGHGRNHAEQTSKVGEWVKARLTPQCHWWFAYTSESADLVAATGFPRERITDVRNAVDTQALAGLVDGLDVADRRRIRAELDLPEQHVGLFVGGLSHDKQLPDVIAAADAVRERVPDFHLVIAGAGPLEPVVREAAQRRPWLHYVGARFGAGKAELLAVADVLLIPAWAGLVVLDAFAGAVPPVASSDRPHPPEIAYVTDDVDGVLVADGGDPRVYGAAVAELLLDPRRRTRLAEGCRRSRASYTVEEMARRFADGIVQALSDEARPRPPRRR
ncbi:glycosyltransferase family 4 protein [Egicoccus halophilus]|uniref:Glycosyl transferase family 1 domain-containing protein n=1 Tax=Egicoccus halophilus TaxID=1670830 RepID=A0A8J3ETL5_9ACTN|nr:glycosyltransferase family 4 protein [Egicoccus halophilus]GGI05438.1 hypothetical protein GCM10011354_14100 [Egicoccus halophilus]